MDSQTNKTTLPSIEELQAQLEIEQQKRRHFKMLRNVVFFLAVIVVAVAIIAILQMSTLQIYGNSMEPALSEGDIVLSKKVKAVESGDIIAFYYDDDILVKRVIADEGDKVDIDHDGTVYVNGEMLEEPYVTEKALGECDITLPCQVPENMIFVMGDQRLTSIDSRYAAIGCIDTEQVIGKLLIRIWPIRDMGFVTRIR